MQATYLILAFDAEKWTRLKESINSKYIIQISQLLNEHSPLIKSVQGTISILVCILSYYTWRHFWNGLYSIHVGTCTSSYGANSNHTHKVPVIPSCQGLACWITATISGLSVITICQSSVRSCKRLQVTLTNETIGQHVHFYPTEP